MAALVFGRHGTGPGELSDERVWKPTREQVAAAHGARVPDVIAPGLRVLFCGINPGLYSGAVGHHFARPGNRFWLALRGSGFTDDVLSPFDEHLLLQRRLGITNLIGRATARADELSAAELRGGLGALSRKIGRYRPLYLAVLGIGAFRTAFGRRDALVGPQEGALRGAGLWVLPNPSGLNAHYRIEDLSRLFAELRREAFRRG